jgi:hypothetical protein
MRAVEWKADERVQVLVGRLVSFVNHFNTSSDVDRTPYAEWVIIETRVAILHALSQCLLAPPSIGQRYKAPSNSGALPPTVALRNVVLAAVNAAGKLAALLHWLYRLSADAVVLRDERPAVHQALHSPLLSSTSSLTIAHVRPPMCAALPEALSAACSLYSAGVTAARAADTCSTSALVPYPTLFRLALLQLETSLGEGTMESSTASEASQRLGCTEQARRRSPLLHALTALHSLAEPAVTAANPAALELLLATTTLLQEHLPEFIARSNAASTTLPATASLLATLCANVGSIVPPMAPHATPMQSNGGSSGTLGSVGHTLVQRLISCLADCSMAATGYSGASLDSADTVPSSTAQAIEVAVLDEAGGSCIQAAAHLVRGACAGVLCGAHTAASLHVAMASVAALLPVACDGGHVLAASAEVLSCLCAVSSRAAGVDGEVSTTQLCCADQGEDDTAEALSCTAAQCSHMLAGLVSSGVLIQRERLLAILQLQLQLCAVAGGGGACATECTHTLAALVAPVCAPGNAVQQLEAATASVGSIREYARLRSSTAHSAGLDALCLAMLPEVVPLVVSAVERCVDVHGDITLQFVQVCVLSHSPVILS